MPKIDYLVSSYDIRRTNKTRYDKKNDLFRVTSKDEKLNTLIDMSIIKVVLQMFIMITS